MELMAVTNHQNHQIPSEFVLKLIGSHHDSFSRHCLYYRLILAINLFCVGSGKTVKYTILKKDRRSQSFGKKIWRVNHFKKRSDASIILRKDQILSHFWEWSDFSQNVELIDWVAWIPIAFLSLYGPVADKFVASCIDSRSLNIIFNKYLLLGNYNYITHHNQPRKNSIFFLFSADHR